jgi:hypothetical protein
MTPEEYSRRFQVEVVDEVYKLEDEIEEELKDIDERKRICTILIAQGLSLYNKGEADKVAEEYEDLYKKLDSRLEEILISKRLIEKKKPPEIGKGITPVYSYDMWHDMKLLKGKILLSKRETEDLKKWEV